MDTIKQGDRIRLTHNSAKGKNRISQYGTLWLVKRVDGDKLLIHSVPEPFCDKRWIKIQGDRDFKVEKIVNEIGKD